MQKKTRTLLITLISFVVVVVVALVAYNSLRDSAPSVSLTPQMAELPKEVVAEPVVAAPVATPPATADTEQAASTDTTTSSDTANAVTEEEVKEPEPDAQAPKMPDIPLYTLEDELTSFDTVREGKPTIINLFASWCPPCKEELPHFQQAYEKYKDQISFIFLDSLDGERETKDTIKKFIKEFPITSPVYYDQGIFAYIFQTNSIPTTVFFNADGTVANGYLGYVSETVLEQNIQALLTQE